MKLKALVHSSAKKAERRLQWETLIESAGKQRPCANCEQNCSRCGSTTCRCNCMPDCELSRRAMSIEPDRFPIEEMIAPLVFALNDLAVCEPYWSCHGHESQQTVPRVWFYADSVEYAKLVNRCVKTLYSRKLLKHSWHVELAYSDDDLGDGYSLEPDATSADADNLQSLRADARVIADKLVNDVRRMAESRLRQQQG